MTAHVVVAHIDSGRQTPLSLVESHLEEAVGLARSLGWTIAAQRSFRLTKPRPGTYVGKGAVDELKTILHESGADRIFMDAALSPTQHRNLERAWDLPVFDRTGLILEIFADRARTREGRLQVALARLTYQKSRLVRSWTHLERQRGALGATGGPGESQIELDRRMIRVEMSALKEELEQVMRTRQLHRRSRQAVPYPIVALVGYTNAGKSTLFNTLTGAEVMAQDRLFATLDPTLRDVRLPSGRHVILSDTVGFIRDLPHELVAAFRATLEEVIEADILLHVHDASHPHHEEQAANVEAVLDQLAAREIPTLEVYNKKDLLSCEDHLRWLNQLERRSAGFLISAREEESLKPLLQAIDDILSQEHQLIQMHIPYAEAGPIVAWLHRHGIVDGKREEDTHLVLSARLPVSHHAYALAMWGSFVVS